MALNVARVLAKGIPSLVDTDTPTSVLMVLAGGAARVDVVGRRGHAQGAFTIKVSVQWRASFRHRPHRPFRDPGESDVCTYFRSFVYRRCFRPRVSRRSCAN